MDSIFVGRGRTGRGLERRAGLRDDVFWVGNVCNVCLSPLAR